jgi:hypothetical protein
MTIPVVPDGTDPSDGRVFVIGTTDGLATDDAVPTTDIVVLAYSLDLKLKWMQTYNYAPVDGFVGDDRPVRVITDQDPDQVTPPTPILYNYVAVLGSVQTPSGTTAAVTLAFCPLNGQMIMLPVVEAGVPVPVDIVACKARPNVGPPAAELGDALFITGQTSAGTVGSQIVTYCYSMPGITCSGSKQNGLHLVGWPRYQTGSYALPAHDPWAIPARMKAIKGNLVITGTTDALCECSPAESPESDMLTFTYNPAIATQTTPTWVHQWKLGDLPGAISYGDSVAADLDVVFYSSEYFAITGRNTSRVDGHTRVATMVYHVSDGMRPWFYGTRWPVGTSEPANYDAGVAIRCIKATDVNSGGSGFNVYVGVKSLGPNGRDYRTLKYFSSANGGFQPIAWTQNLPLYNGASNGDDIPFGIAAESHPGITFTGESRRIWTTGTSWGGFSANDWATQFNVEEVH